MMYISRPTSPSGRYGQKNTATQIWNHARFLVKTELTLVFIHPVPFCRHNPRAGKQQSGGFLAYQRSSVCHSPIRMEGREQQNKKGFTKIMLISSSSPSHLKQRDFADDRVVDIYSNVQTHFVWQLGQQFLLIWKAHKDQRAESDAWLTSKHVNIVWGCPYPACLATAKYSCTRFWRGFEHL